MASPKRKPKPARTSPPKREPKAKAKPGTIEQVPADERDDELAEAWTRVVDPADRMVHGVEAARWPREPAKFPWRVTVWVLEYIRDDELQVELRKRIAKALRAVPGVTNIAEQDREVWVIAGSPSGKALIAAVATVVDALAQRTLAFIQALR